MSDHRGDLTTLPIAEPLSRQQQAAVGRSGKMTVSGKLKVAIDSMVWSGLKREQAATKAGLTPHGLYVAFSRPHVKRYYLEQLDVLRTSARARNIHVLEEVRDQTGNQMARVNAVKALEQISDEPANQASRSSPGLVVVVVQGPASMSHTHVIEAKPLITHEVVRNDE